ncbi:MAG: signal peptidase I [Candidatus Aminicenantaceae bacterium]
MLKSPGLKPLLFVKKGGELSLPGQELTRLLQAVLEKGASFRFRARGFSMFPFIKDGDVITVDSLSGGKPRLGDVLVYVNPRTRKIVVHRMIGKRRDCYIIKGDNTPDSDGIIPRENILGRVKRVEREGKRIFLGLGVERVIIALLIRAGILSPFFLPVVRITRVLKRKRVR